MSAPYIQAGTPLHPRYLGRNEVSEPFGVNRLHNIFARRDQVSAGLPNGLLVTAVCEPYDSLPSRIRAAWWVLTGRAHALIWPEAGDIEATLYPEHLRNEPIGKLPEKPTNIRY